MLPSVRFLTDPPVMSTLPPTLRIQRRRPALGPKRLAQAAGAALFGVTVSIAMGTAWYGTSLQRDGAHPAADTLRPSFVDSAAIEVVGRPQLPPPIASDREQTPPVSAASAPPPTSVRPSVAKRSPWRAAPAAREEDVISPSIESPTPSAPEHPEPEHDPAAPEQTIVPEPTQQDPGEPSS